MKALLVTAEKTFVWPFPFVNGQQTDQSKALMLDKEAQKPSGACVQFNLSTIEEALL